MSAITIAEIHGTPHQQIPPLPVILTQGELQITRKTYTASSLNNILSLAYVPNRNLSLALM